MVISKNTQLALMMKEMDWELTQELLADLKGSLEGYLGESIPKEGEDKYGLRAYTRLESDKNDGDSLLTRINAKLGYHPENKGSEFYTIKHPNPFYYLIMKSVDKCAELIRVNEKFSCTIFNKIKDGCHIYLLGKHQYFHYTKFNGAIRSMYWDREKHVAFEIGFDLEDDMYYFPSEETQTFNRLVRLMIFIELGDIEIVELPAGRNNGSTKKSGEKISNTSNNTVYVVDSSWNKLIIRTDGFAVRGHFRLQPCGANMADRKLIWINSFEKHGFTRRPKAEIIHH